jgi:hypothetical protein
MSRNGDRHPARPSIELSGGWQRGAAGVSPEEAAAIAAAIEQFLRDTAPAPEAGGPGGVAPWARAAMLEGTGHRPPPSSPWGEPVRWGA